MHVLFENDMLWTDYDIIILVETWLNENIADNELFIPSGNFALFRKDRPTRGGGVLVYVKQDLMPMRSEELENAECECIWIRG